MSNASCVMCGRGLTLVGDELLLLVMESFGLEVKLVLDVAPVVVPCAALSESLVHTRLGLGSVLD